MTPTWISPKGWNNNDGLVSSAQFNAEIRANYISIVLDKCNAIQDVMVADLRPFSLLTAPSLDVLGCDVKRFRERMNQLAEDGYDWKTVRDVATFEALAAKGLVP